MIALERHFRRPYRILFKWSDVWSSFGTPLSDPTEEKAWRRLVHRAIDAKNRHSKSPTNPNPDHKCRLRCGERDESMLHMITCKHSRPYWTACFDFCHKVLGATQYLGVIDAVIFNMHQNTLLGEAVRAFLRHAVGKWYASMTAVFREDKVFVWEATFLWTVQGFRAAVLRRCYNIKKHYANRVHTNLVAVVSEEERAKYPTLVSIQQDGEHKLTTNFERAIDDAERTREAAATHQRQ